MSKYNVKRKIAVLVATTAMALTLSPISAFAGEAEAVDIPWHPNENAIRSIVIDDHTPSKGSLGWDAIDIPWYSPVDCIQSVVVDDQSFPLKGSLGENIFPRLDIFNL